MDIKIILICLYVVGIFAEPRCKSQDECNEGRCCSKYGWCGAGDWYCGSADHEESASVPPLNKQPCQDDQQCNNGWCCLIRGHNKWGMCTQDFEFCRMEDNSRISNTLFYVMVIFTGALLCLLGVLMCCYIRLRTMIKKINQPSADTELTPLAAPKDIEFVPTNSVQVY